MMRLRWTLMLMALGAGLFAQENPDTGAAAAAEDASDADVVQQVLAETLGTWQREGPSAVLSPAQLRNREGEAVETYQATCGATARYRNAEGPGTAEVLVIAFESRLDALGFLSAQRTGDARLVVLTLPAYRDSGVLHARSGRYYLRVTARGTPTEALPADQHLAAEVELPPPGARLRLLDLIPRGWITPLTVSYAPTDLLGEDVSPKALSVEHLLGTKLIRLTVMQAEDVTGARRYYTLLLQQALQADKVREMRRLGEEAFVTRRDDAPAIGMRQDEFVAYVTDVPNLVDGEAIMRMVGTAIRTSRPLPEVTVSANEAPRPLQQGGEQ
ncbi:MAG: DUF6599 family protein [Armatimonadota bacterium]|nr:DUF6599 family protein [Armatimonadota bacterium]